MALFVCFHKEVWERLQCIIIHNCSLPCTVQTRMLRYQLLGFPSAWCSAAAASGPGSSSCWMAALTQDGFALAMRYGSHPTSRATCLCNLYCRSSSNVKALHVNTGEHHNTTQGIIILDINFVTIIRFTQYSQRMQHDAV